MSIVAGGQLGLSLVNAGTASVAASGATITDGDTDIDIVAGKLLLTATGGIGNGGDALELSVGTLSAKAGAAGLFPAEANGLVAGSVSVATDVIAASGVATAGTAVVQEDLFSGGALVITVAPGDLTLTADTGAVTGDGLVLLQAAGALAANARVTGASHVSLVAASIAQGADGDIVANGSIDVQATGGAITMADGAMAQSNGGNIGYAATGAISVGLLDARSAGVQSTRGAVSILSGAAITDNAGESAIDVYANQLRLEAATGIASGSERLETEVAVLAAQAGSGGVYRPKRARWSSAPRPT
ncbi:hypothetical protein HK414_15935 [Ramlibacter terrae]|uniref:Uncharacterized protein n=1 Tax=Ramlibacter terrae TaxID=2732511 RepID=A0ABX6P559_9BURK|nr:hypothetical protein HK414_15935 [Ramlibacter terrae]